MTTENYIDRRISLAVLNSPALRGTAATLQGLHLLLCKLKVGQCRGQEIGGDRGSNRQQVRGEFGVSRLRDHLSRRLERRDCSNLSQIANLVSSLSLTKIVPQKSHGNFALTEGAIVCGNVFYDWTKTELPMTQRDLAVGGKMSRCGASTRALLR